MKNEHTEHCCVLHGCKYGEDNCPVVTKTQPQSSPCEICGADGINSCKVDIETSIYKFKSGCFYNFLRQEDQNPSLLYVMGFLKGVDGEENLICEIFMPSNFYMTGRFAFESSIQGTDKILISQWQEVSKEEFEKLKIQYDTELEADESAIANEEES